MHTSLALTDNENWLVLFQPDSNWQFLQSALRPGDFGHGIPRAPRHSAVEAIGESPKCNDLSTCKLRNNRTV